MAQLYCTGPAHVYVASAPASPGAAVYLGTCEDAPEVELAPEYEGVRNDIGGKKKPFDMQYQGEDALISLDLNRYNEPVYAVLANRPRNFLAGATPRGTNTPLDVGTLILTEGFNIQLFLLFQFGGAGSAPKIAMTAGGMPPGYRFPCTIPIAPEKLNMGTKPKKIHLTMYAFRLWDVNTQTFVLYDTSVAGLPAIN